MDNSSLIMNFTGQYLDERLDDFLDAEVLNFTNMEGVVGYCQEDSESLLSSIISDQKLDAVHWLDSGDFHYLTKLWCDQIEENFSLILFDNHSDMQTPILGDFLSCGGWVKNMLEENVNLDSVLVLGVEEEPIKELENMPEEYEEKVHILTSEDVDNLPYDKLENYLLEQPKIYLSFDTDVLNEEEAVTNWNQGEMDMEQVEKLFKIIGKNSDVIGMDICGGLSNNDWHNDDDLDLNLKANLRLFNFAKSYF